MVHSLNTRRWPRYHVHLPVLIASESGQSHILIPGLVSEISRRGMELYGGVQLRPGDVMEVEFRTSAKLRVASVVRNRSGYCFGLEFLSIASGSQPAVAASGHVNSPSSSFFESLLPDPASPGDADADPNEETYAELFNERHEAYLYDMHRTIARLREKSQEIRQFRHEMELLLNRELGKSPGA